MKVRLHSTCMAVVAGLGVVASSTICAAQVGDADYSVRLSGACARLVHSGTDMTATCLPVLRHNNVKSGQDPSRRLSMWSFVTSDGTISFAGAADPAIALDDDTWEHPVDTVMFSMFNSDAGPVVAAAVGSCRHDDLSMPATVICNARTSQGLFEGEFLTDRGASESLPSR